MESVYIFVPITIICLIKINIIPLVIFTLLFNNVNNLIFSLFEHINSKDNAI